MEKEIKNKKMKAITVISIAVISLLIASLGPGLIADSVTDPVVGEDTYSGPVRITLLAEDPGENPSGVKETYYVINPETQDPEEMNWQVYREPIKYEEEGEHVIFYYSVDNAGNEEEIQRKSFIIRLEPQDTTPPVTTCIIEEME